MMEDRSSQYYQGDDGLWRGVGFKDGKYYFNDIPNDFLLSAALDIEEMFKHDTR